MKQWVIRDGISQEARNIVKRLAKEEKVNIGRCVENIIMSYSHLPNLKKTYSQDEIFTIDSEFKKIFDSLELMRKEIQKPWWRFWG